MYLSDVITAPTRGSEVIRWVKTPSGCFRREGFESGAVGGALGGGSVSTCWEALACTHVRGNPRLGGTWTDISLQGDIYFPPGPAAPSFVIRLFRLSLSIKGDNYLWEAVGVGGGVASVRVPPPTQAGWTRQGGLSERLLLALNALPFRSANIFQKNEMVSAWARASVCEARNCNKTARVERQQSGETGA